MASRSYERGDVVYLTAEIGTGKRIHEIGARAEVRSVSDGLVELAFESAARETVWCAAERVVRAVERRTRIPSPSGRWQLRPRIAPS